MNPEYLSAQSFSLSPQLFTEGEVQTQLSLDSSQDPQQLMKQAQVQLHAFEQVHQKLQEAYRKFENTQL